MATKYKAPQNVTFLIIKYGSIQAVIDRYCEARLDEFRSPEHQQLAEFMAWWSLVYKPSKNKELFNESTLP